MFVSWSQTSTFNSDCRRGRITHSSAGRSYGWYRTLRWSQSILNFFEIPCTACLFSHTQVVNALLTQLDKLKHRRNVLVMATSNLVKAIGRMSEILFPCDLILCSFQIPLLLTEPISYNMLTFLLEKLYTIFFGLPFVKWRRRESLRRLYALYHIYGKLMIMFSEHPNSETSSDI